MPDFPLPEEFENEDQYLRHLSYEGAKRRYKEMHTCQWWEELLQKSEKINIKSITEMNCFDEAWDDWVHSTNDFQEFSDSDRPAIEAGAGKYMNFVSILATKK